MEVKAFPFPLTEPGSGLREMLMAFERRRKVKIGA